MRTIKKRRKQNKTDYLGRLKLLKSGKPRVVFRRTNKYIIVQYITSKQAQDKNCPRIYFKGFDELWVEK